LHTGVNFVAYGTGIGTGTGNQSFLILRFLKRMNLLWKALNENYVGAARWTAAMSCRRRE